MARSRRLSRPTAITSRSLVERLVRRYVPLSPSIVFEDRRTWHPLREVRPARAISRWAAHAAPRARGRPFSMADAFGFMVPNKVGICVRRKQRREVLFAKRMTRSGGAKRRNYWSSVSCRSR